MQVAASVADYIRQFHLACVYATSTGAIGCTSDPTRLRDATRVWWLASPLDAIRLRDEARLTGNVPRVAEELGIALHEHVIASAKERTLVLKRAFQKLRKSGYLRFFNQEYRRRREAARAAGRRFMSYETARSRLRAVVAVARSKNGAMTRSLILQVFEPDYEPIRRRLLA